jgi:hypothetical protein
LAQIDVRVLHDHIMDGVAAREVAYDVAVDGVALVM